MTTITAKATQVASTAGLGPHFDITGVIAIIQQVFSALSACNPKPAQVHQSISRPAAFQRIALRRTVRANEPNPALRQHLEAGVLAVGSASTEEETTAMYTEATVAPPA